MMSLSARFQAAPPYTWEEVEAFADRLQARLGDWAQVHGRYSDGEVRVRATGQAFGIADTHNLLRAVREVAPPLALSPSWSANTAQIEAGRPATPYIPVEARA